jgi:hypothetical protein
VPANQNQSVAMLSQLPPQLQRKNLLPKPLLWHCDVFYYFLSFVVYRAASKNVKKNQLRKLK